MGEGESDDGTSRLAACAVDFGKQLRLETIRVDRHFAGGNFGIGGALKAEFTNAESVFRANRRTERAASHGAMRVEVAGSGFRIERRARLMVGEVLKLALAAGAFTENAGFAIAGKVVSNAVEGLACALPNVTGASGVGDAEFSQALAEPRYIELVDGEDADAALRAAGTTDEPGTSALGSLDESGVENLDELVVGGRTEEHRKLG